MPGRSGVCGRVAGGMGSGLDATRDQGGWSSSGRSGCGIQGETLQKDFEMVEAENAWLLGLDEETLEDLAYAIEGVLSGIREKRRRVKTLPNVDQRKLTRLRNKYYDELKSLGRRLETQEIGVATFEKEAAKLIRDHFRAAYALGKPALDDGDEEWVRRAAEEELKHARKMAKGISSEKVKGDSIDFRAGAYARTLDGVAEHGNIERQPDNVRIHWRLGDAEHCVDCQILAANSPYTKLNLPTTPRAGGTVCLSNCKCHLEYEQGALSNEEVQDVETFKALRDQGVDQYLGMDGYLLEGLREPTFDEEKVLLDRNLRANFYRRKSFDLGLSSEERIDAKLEGSKAERQVLEFLEERRIYQRPYFQIEGELGPLEIGRRAVREIFRDALDGKTIAKVPKKRLKELLRGLVDSE